MSSLNDQMTNLGSGLTSLTFSEFTWDDGNGGYKMISAANLRNLYYYMRTHYPGVTTIDEMPPYLIIWCEETIPEPSKRPFLIGGLLAIWLVEGQGLPPEIMGGFLGNLQIDSDYVDDLRPYHIPTTKTLCLLISEGFPDALAVSFIDNQIFVELPELPRNEHAKRLQRCPGWFAHDGLKLFYYNGLRITTQRNKELGQSRTQGREGKLLHSDMLKMDDIYMVDDDAMGSHTAMLCKGKTVVSQTDQVIMGIFATSDPVAYGEPGIRAGCCGSALVRLERSIEAEGGLVENSGKIGGFIVGSEFGEGGGDDDFPRVLCYAEVNDGLIEAGREAE
ncbi:hypothetical protein VE00_03120 [Pseudogymnoascus sp. WSF 3629]|nr:hypothetical protein VE00_03120 [Pseudogymnoascus sp. WSF 3629]